MGETPLTNHRLGKLVSPAFREWLRSTRFVERRLATLTGTMKAFLSERVFADQVALIGFVGNAHLTLCRCNDLDVQDENDVSFDTPGVVPSYASWHFLERYLRFFEVFLRIVELGYFPLKTTNLKSIDIGTGPAPCIFALSDITAGLTEFSKTADCPGAFPPKQFFPDYVENSGSFRQWIHHFTECANMSGSADEQVGHIAWRTPYHMGTLDDAYSINLRGMGPRHAGHKVHIVTLGNFLTEAGQANRLAHILEQSYRTLANGGLLVITGKHRSLQDNVRDVSDLLVPLGAHDVSECDVNVAFSHSEGCAELLRGFYAWLSDELDRLSVSERLDSIAVNALAEGRGVDPRPPRWNLHIFRKGRLPGGGVPSAPRSHRRCGCALR